MFGALLTSNSMTVPNGSVFQGGFFCMANIDEQGIVYFSAADSHASKRGHHASVKKHRRVEGVCVCMFHFPSFLFGRLRFSLLLSFLSERSRLA